MFITRASRHDKADLAEFLGAHGNTDSDVSEGLSYVARDGGIVGCVRLVEVAPETVVVDDVLVAERRRGEGIGRRVIQAAMNAKGGTLYLCCHDDKIAFYSHFGFSEVDFDSMPDEVRAYFERVGDHPTDPGHTHHFLKAR
ncbi:MAG TPA: GNAT family N-acetyltransferase [Actinomycetota bacterium]|nr:GNAT family N-acetyltransferase [Actinomycetota bacterium]